MGTDVKSLEIPWWLQLSKKVNTYVFAAPIIRDREVGGSNPLAPTNQFKHLRLPAKVAVLVLWPICGHVEKLPLGLIGLPEYRSGGFISLFL